MTKDQLIDELKQNNNLTPQNILLHSDLSRIASDLSSIFETEKEELDTNDLFRANFTELVNYLYLLMLEARPQERNKEIFSDSIINFLLSPPHPAV